MVRSFPISKAAVGHTTAALRDRGSYYRRQEESVMSESRGSITAGKQTPGQLPPWYVKVEYGAGTQHRDASLLWFAPVLWGMALAVYIIAEIRTGGDALTAGILWVMFALFALGCTIPWYRLFFRGYLVWIDCKDKVVRLTSRGYPEDAEGMVVKVCIRVFRPYLTMYWGADAWQYVDPFAEAAYYINRQGTKIPQGDTQAMETYGLTGEVRELLGLKTSYKWRIRTPCAGTLLRFVENKSWAPRQAIDVCPHEFHLIPEILQAGDAQTFWELRRRREMGMEQDRRALMEREQAVQKALHSIHVALDLETPDEPDGPSPVEAIERAVAELYSRHCTIEQVRGVLCQLLRGAHARMTDGGRLVNRINQREDVLNILVYLNEHLPKDHPLRPVHNVSAESVSLLRGELQELQSRLARPHEEAAPQG